MALTITNDNLQELIDSGVPTVVDFWAEWCGPCRTIAPIIDELSKEYEGRVNIGKCDVSENDALATKYAVHHIPTIIFLKNGELIDKHVGAASKAMLEEKIAKCL